MTAVNNSKPWRFTDLLPVEVMHREAGVAGDLLISYL